MGVAPGEQRLRPEDVRAVRERAEGEAGGACVQDSGDRVRDTPFCLVVRTAPGRSSRCPL